jgi:hypothetical protein
MPIEQLYSDSEILKIQKSILFKMVISKEELQILKEINIYLKKK